MHQGRFVCTGNIFRSLTAEFALRQQPGNRPDLWVASAGTAERHFEVHPSVRDYLRSRGIDVSSHRRRTVRADMLRGRVSVIAMSTDHRGFIAQHFLRRDVALFTEACGLDPAPLPDIHEAVSDCLTNAQAAEAHVRLTIDRILGLTPRLASRPAQLTDPAELRTWGPDCSLKMTKCTQGGRCKH